MDCGNNVIQCANASSWKSNLKTFEWKKKMKNLRYLFIYASYVCLFSVLQLNFIYALY